MQLITIDNKLSLEAEQMIINHKEELSRIKELESNFNSALLKEMEDKGIISYKDDNLSISFIQSGERETFDSKSLKEKYPFIYNEFVKKSKVKSSVRVSIKKGITSDNMKEINKAEIVQISNDLVEF